MDRSRNRTLVVVAASLSVLLGACGVAAGSRGAVEQVSSGAGRTVAASTLTAAGRSTADVPSERVSMTVTTTTDGKDGLTVTAEGAFDPAAGRGHLETSVSGVDGPMADLASTEAVYDGDTVYLRSGIFESFSGGKPWIKITHEQLGEVSGKLEGSVHGDPGSFLDMLEGAGTVKEVGRATVRSVDTTHYRATVDLTKALDRLDEKRRKRLESTLDSLGPSLDVLRKVPLEAWIDDDGHVRRITQTMDLGTVRRGTTSAEVSVTQTVELYDFGAPVEITVPKASEVSELDLSKLFHN